MATYESTFIFSPEIPAEKVDELIGKIKKIVEGSEGLISVSQNLGRKKLSYPIKKFKEGVYFFLEFSNPGKAVADIEKFCKVNDSVIRYLTVKKAKKPKPAKVAAEKPTPKEGEAHDDQHKPEVAGTK